MCIEELKEEDSEFRLLVWKIHGKSERLRFLKDTHSKSPEISKGIDNLSQAVENERHALERNSIFTAMRTASDKKKRKKASRYLRGKDAHTLDGKGISKRADIDPAYYEYAYDSLSQYVHAYPFSIEQLGHLDPDDAESINLFNMTTSIAGHYFAKSLKEMYRIFGDPYQEFLDPDLGTQIDIMIGVMRDYKKQF